MLNNEGALISEVRLITREYGMPSSESLGPFGCFLMPASRRGTWRSIALVFIQVYDDRTTYMRQHCHCRNVRVSPI